MPKFKNSNATFWVIFKQCVQGVPASFGLTPCSKDLLDMVSDARLWDVENASGKSSFSTAFTISDGWEDSVIL